MSNLIQKHIRNPSLWGIQFILLTALFAGAYLISVENVYGLFIIVAMVVLGILLLWIINLSYRNLAITLTAGSFFLPPVPIPGLWTLPIPYLLVLFLFPFIITEFRKVWNWIDLGFLLLGISTIISLLWGSIFLNVPISPLRDGMELVKLIAYWLFFRIGVHAWKERELRQLMNWVLLGISIAILIGFIQRYNVFGLAFPFKSLYGYGGVHIYRAARIIGTLRDPNTFAVLMVTGFALVIGAWRWYRPRILLILIAAGCFINIIFTVSRTALLALLVVLGVVLSIRFMHIWWKHRSKLLPVVFILLMLTIVVGLQVYQWGSNEMLAINELEPVELLEYTAQSPFNQLMFRLSRVSDFTRLDRWEESWEIFLKSPILGWGPGEAIHTTIVDNEYLLYLRRYGLFGMALYFLWYSQIPRIFLRVGRKYPQDSVVFGISLSVLAILLAYLVSNIFLSTFYVLQIMSAFWLLVGISYSSLLYRIEPIRNE
jgi:O-antigen ligase